jgi:hypothetical protein
VILRGSMLFRMHTPVELSAGSLRAAHRGLPQVLTAGHPMAKTAEVGTYLRRPGRGPPAGPWISALIF